jgi:hypothetical protein
MAIYSARLAGTTTFVGLLFSASTLGSVPAVPVLLTVGLLLWAAWSWTRTRRMWTHMSVRTHVVTTVAAG